MGSRGVRMLDDHLAQSRRQFANRIAASSFTHLP
jgi:hypothetical protein